MRGRWGQALKECIEGDVKSFLAAMEDPSDYVDGRVANPAQLGGGFARTRLFDTTGVEIDRTTIDRRNEVMWHLGGYLKSDVYQKKNRAYIKDTATKALFPEMRLPYVYRSRHAALDTAKKLQARAQGKRDKVAGTDGAVPDEVLAAGCASKDLVPTSHPLMNGPAYVAEDTLSRELEAERRADAMLRMKFEIFTNRIQARFLNNQFTPSKKSMNQQTEKSVWKFYYDGDDLQYTHEKPLWMQELDKRRGGGTTIGGDLDATRQRHFQRFIRKVSELGSPETVGDVHRLLGEQKALQSDFFGAEHAVGQRYSAMIHRREQAMKKRSTPIAMQFREAVDAEQPLVTRVTNKRRKKMLLDEAAADAAADVLLATASVKSGRDYTRRLAFQDEREEKLVHSADPRDFLPEPKRATTYLDKFTMPGTLEDPRQQNPFVLARTSSHPLASDLRGRPVAVWEADDGAGLPGKHHAITEKIARVFDYHRAADRVMNGLQEKAVCDWRPTTSAQQLAFEESSRSRGMFNRRPAGFWARENPDIRMTKEWDDILGAPFLKDSNQIDKVEFYKKRLAWEKRKELAIRWGLQPKANETIAERKERREKLDIRIDGYSKRQGDALNNSYGWMHGQWNEPGKVLQWYGKRHFRDRSVFNSDFYPLSQRPLNDLLKLQVIESNPTRVSKNDFTQEEAEEVRFLQDWYREDVTTVKRRKGDPRMDYLETAGRSNKSGAMQPANNYIQVQDCLWELRTYRGEPEPGPEDRTYLETSQFVNMMNDSWFKSSEEALRNEFLRGLLEEHRDGEAVKDHDLLDNTADQIDSHLGWKSPDGVDKWKAVDDGCKEGLELHREMTFPIEEVNHVNTHRWLAKTPWDRIAAKDLTTKIMNPEDDGRPMELGTSYYFNRNRLHYHRLPVQRLRAYGPELRELKHLSEKLIPDEVAHKIKNHYAVARHNAIPYFSNYVTKNGPKFMNTPKVQFDSVGLHDDLEDYIRVNPHLSKWEAM